MDTIQFENFILKHPPIGNLEKANSQLLEKYKTLVPNGLLEIWEQHGFGFYGNGFLQLINPDDFHEVLCGWLLRKPDPTRIPIMITAFGTVIYYRMLERDEENATILAEDVAYLEPNYRETNVCSWSLDGFFDDYICNQDILQEMFYYNNFEIAKEKYGVLETNNMYCFTLALSLGGSEDIDKMMQGNAIVQLDLLLQLTSNEDNQIYTDDNWEDEMYKLQNPQEFDNKINELEQALNSNSDAFEHFKLAKICKTYPYYDSLIIDSDSVKATMIAKTNHYLDKAILLDPTKSDYYLYRAMWELDNFSNLDTSKVKNDLEQYKESGGTLRNYYYYQNELAKILEDENLMVLATEKLFEIDNNNNTYLENLALYYEQNQQYEKALNLYNRCVDNEIEFYNQYVYQIAIAKILYKQNNPEQAKAIFENALKEKHNPVEVNKDNAEALLQSDVLEKENQAINLFLEAEKAFDQDTDDYQKYNIYFSLYDLYNQKRHYSLALEAINNALLYDNYDYPKGEKVKLLQKMGRTEEAEAVKQTLDLPNQSYQYTPNYNQDDFWSSEIDILNNEYEAFDIKIEQLKQDFLKNPSKANQTFLLAKVYENYPFYTLPDEGKSIEKEYRKNALDYFNLAISQEQNASFYLARANFLYHYGSDIQEDGTYDYYDTIASDYNEFLRLTQGDKYDAYEGLMRVYQFKDDYTEAVYYGNLAYQTRPENTYLLLNIGSDNQKANQFADALNAYNELLLVEPESYNAIYAQCGIAEIYILKNEPKRAILLFEKILKTKTTTEDQSDSLLQFANSFGNNSFYNEAANYCQQAIQLIQKDPPNEYALPSALFSLATFQEHLNVNEAIATMKKLCELNAEVYYFVYLGDLYMQKNNTSDAKNSFTKALELEPENEYAKQQIDELNNKKGFFNKIFKR